MPIYILASLHGFIPMIEEFWSGTDELFHSTSALFRFSKKLKELKPMLKGIHKEKLGNLPRQAREAFDCLCEKQQETLTNPTTQNLVEES